MPAIKRGLKLSLAFHLSIVGNLFSKHHGEKSSTLCEQFIESPDFPLLIQAIKISSKKADSVALFPAMACLRYTKTKIALHLNQFHTNITYFSILCNLPANFVTARKESVTLVPTLVDLIDEELRTLQYQKQTNFALLKLTTVLLRFILM